MPDKIVIDTQQLETTIKTLARRLQCNQATATAALGYVMKLTDRIVTAEEAHEYILKLINTKGPEELDIDERLLCVTIGVLRRKIPFIAAASKVGRNERCPCGSGAKYKNCCLEMAKEHDFNRFYGGAVK